MSDRALLLTFWFFCVLLVIFIGLAIALSSSKLRKNISKQFGFAGWYTERSRIPFYILCVVSIVLGYVLAVAVANWNAARGENPISMLDRVSVMLLFVGFIVPLAHLNSSQKQYRQRISTEVPQVLGMFVVCLHAGYSVDQTLEYCVTILAKYRYGLTSEIQRTLNDLKYLVSRDDAWNNWLKRVDYDENFEFVRLIKQGERLGSSHLLNILLRQRQLLWEQRLARIEVWASKAAVMLILPVVFLIMPVIFIVLLAPPLLEGGVINFFG